MGRRAWMLAALIGLLGFLAGLAVGARRHDIATFDASLPTEATEPPPQESSALAAAPLQAQPRRTPRQAADPLETPPSLRAELRPAGVVVLNGIHPASIRVRVVGADGTAVVGAGVSALAEGARSVETEEGPSAETDAEGRATLHVPSVGRHAVTALSGLLVAVREGVEATADGGAEIELALGRMATFEVRRTGVARAARWTARASASAPTLADGTVMGSPRCCSVSGDGDRLELPLPEGVPFDVRIDPVWPDPGWRGLEAVGPLQAVVTAPGELTVEFRERAAVDKRTAGPSVQLTLRIEAESGGLPRSGRIAFQLRELIGGVRSSTHDGWLDWGPEDEEITIRHAPHAWPPRTPGRIEWAVAGVSGGVDVPAGLAGETQRLESVVRIPATMVVTGLAGLEVVDGRGTPIPIGGPEETSANLFSEAKELGFTTEEGAAASTRGWLRDRAGKPITATRGRWEVSESGTAEAGGALRLRLVLGGYLLVHLRTPLSQNLGRLIVERADGAWLGHVVGEDALPSPTERRLTGTYFSGAGAIQNGTLLGPLPPGDVGLRFLLGGVEVGRTTAHVVAGEVSVLTIR